MARELATVGDLGRVEDPLTLSGQSDLLRAAEIDRRQLPPLSHIDHRNGVVERFCHIDKAAVGRNRQSTRALPHRDAPLHELGRDSEVVGQQIPPVLLTRSIEHRSHAPDIHHRDFVDSAAGNEGESAVGGDRHIGRVGKVVVGLVEQELVDPAVAPQHADAVGDHPTLQHAGHGDQVLGSDQSHQGELAARRHIDPLHQIRLGDHHAILDHRTLGSDHRDLGPRRRSEGHEVRKVVGDKDLTAIG